MPKLNLLTTESKTINIKIKNRTEIKILKIQIVINQKTYFKNYKMDNNVEK